MYISKTLILIIYIFMVKGPFVSRFLNREA